MLFVNLDSISSLDMTQNKEPNANSEHIILGSRQHIGIFSTQEVTRIFIKNVSCHSEFNKLC
jgi:hypothetical protein